MAEPKHQHHLFTVPSLMACSMASLKRWESRLFSLHICHSNTCRVRPTVVVSSNQDHLCLHMCHLAHLQQPSLVGLRCMSHLLHVNPALRPLI